MQRLIAALVSLAAFLAAPSGANAANILFISNVGGDTNIPTVLRNDGHTVVIGAGFRDLERDLSEFDAVFWSATDSSRVPASVFSNLEGYVMAGGRVFVTGDDALISSSLLTQFCGGNAAWNFPGAAPSSIIDEENSLTTGVVDIRGLTPTGGHTNLDGLRELRSDTVAVIRSVAGAEAAPWTLRRLGLGEIAFVSNGEWGSAHPSWEVTASDGSGAYNAALRNFAAAGEPRTTEPGAPAITITAPRFSHEGEEIVATVAVEDAEGDTVTFSWDLDGNGTFGENEGNTTFVVGGNTTDGPALLKFGVQAVDAEGHTSTAYRTVRILNVAPVITSEPPRVTSVGAAYRYPVIVEDPAGALDPIRITLVRRPSGMEITQGGVIQWTPSESDVRQPGGTAVEIAIDDGDGGKVSQSWTVTVEPNTAPMPPTPAYPTNMIAIIETTPRLVVENAMDRDVDRLTYYFQLDTVETFDSPDLRESGAIEEMPGFTAWTLDEPLAPGRIYYWRVWANDGAADSAQRTAAFYVVPDPALDPPDAGPGDGSVPSSDGGVSSDAGPDGGGSSGGGCSAVSSRSSSEGAWLWLALAALALALRRSR